MSPRVRRRNPTVEPIEAIEPTEAVPSGEVGPLESAPIVPAPVVPETGVPATRLRISRRKKDEPKAHFQEFKVAVDPGATVLDALLEIRRSQDPSLVVRHSCIHASCGTCGIRVNGRESLACDTPLASLPPGKPLKVEPLAGQRLVADLATDMVDFYARFEAAGMPQVRAVGPADARAAAAPAGPSALDSVHALSRFENCIECGLCLSACPISRANQDFIGPAALAAAARVVAEPRGVDLGPVLALAAEPDSVWGCHSAMECSAVCPAGVEPAMALFELRRRVAADGLKRLLRRGAGRDRGSGSLPGTRGDAV
ncbi:MAG TPA: 2Fe-2S iron-sulfur cluster-binding protein [Candidatus Limnocylindrales bacterium]